MPVARTPLVVALVSVIVTAASVSVGLSQAGTDDERDRGTAGPTAWSAPLASFDTSALVVARTSFCPGLGSEQVADALGGDVESSSSYANGETARLTRRVRDVAHEFNCTWHTADGTTARAWVFAPPVTRERATDLVDGAVNSRGCTPIADAPAFGLPSAGLVCVSPTATEASYRGLFGDAWLSCSIAAPTSVARDELVDRTGRWCVAVATAATSTTSTS